MKKRKIKEIAYHTHDSITWKRCRRKWWLSSPFGLHLEPKFTKETINPNLWFGTGFHFALEDYHGYNRFKNPVKAFEAYINSRSVLEEIPEDIDTYRQLGHDMLQYYIDWEKKYAEWKTIWKDDKPLVEVPFSLVMRAYCYYLFEDNKYYEQESGKFKCKENGEIVDEEFLLDQEAIYYQIVFHGTLDRVVEYKGEWYVLDYKTAKVFDTDKLSLDQQISNYCWAAEQYLDHPIAGMIYIQCSKNPPKAPRLTKNGVSTAKNQRTTREAYKQVLIENYGSVSNSPEKCVEMLNHLTKQQTANGTPFIRFDVVTRSQEMKISTGLRLQAELEEILNTNVCLYCNPTKDCSWDCPFKNTICLAMEENTDWEYYIDEEYTRRNETLKNEIEPWKKQLYKKYKEVYPKEYKKYWQEGYNTVDDFLNSL